MSQMSSWTITLPGAKSKGECKPCPPGTEAQASTGCEPCFEGSFKSSFDGLCLLCPGFRSMVGATKCTPCPPGQVQVSTVSGPACEKCPRGSTTFGFGNSFCRVRGEKCDISYFEDKAGDCRRCRNGYRVNLITKKCVKCPRGSVSAGGVNTLCVKCKKGKQPNFDNTKCVCPKGSEETSKGGCRLCPPGYENRFARSTCEKCFAGTFASGRGSTSCKRCPDGTFSSNIASKCTKCPKGFLPDTFQKRGPPLATSCVSTSTNCKAGFIRKAYLDDDGVFSFSDCTKRILCTADTPPEDIGKKCAPCPPGTFASLIDAECFPCGQREVSPGGTVTNCKKCPDGLLRSFFDGSKCSCPRGLVMRKGKCRPCPRGTRFLGEDERRKQRCEPCPPGTFSPKKRIIGAFDEKCEECPIDTFSTGGAAKCKKCPEGTISNLRPGGTKCIPLPA